jgi:hypothetical protein
MFPAGLAHDSRWESASEPELIAAGVSALQASFSDVGAGPHIVPLSGGLDSRAVIAGLFEAGAGSNVTAVSFGEPGSYDYEISAMLANKFGMGHRRIDLGRVPIDEDALVRTAENGAAWTYLFDAYFNSLICSEGGHDTTYWSGFMGDPLAGSHIPAQPSGSWDEAKRYYLSHNILPGETDVVAPGCDLASSLPTAPMWDSSVLSFDDQLDFAIRQWNYALRVVTCRGYDYRTPFLGPAWTQFILSVPRRYRLGKHLYEKILVAAYPDWFSMPTTGYVGGSVTATKAEVFARKAALRIASAVGLPAGSSVRRSLHLYGRANYIDFADAFRRRPEYTALVRGSIGDLKKRDIVTWIDLDAVVRDHMSGQRNNSIVLVVLTAMEASLKASGL